MRKKRIERLKEGERAAALSSIAVLLLGALEAFVGTVSGSIALVADGIHNASDSLTTFASWFGLRVAQRAPDRKFPYGYYKAESLAALFVSVFILWASVNLAVEGYRKIFSPPIVSFPGLALATAATVALASYLLGRYLKRVGKAINSHSLLVSGREKYMDTLVSSAVFVTVVLAACGVAGVEGLVTVGIAVLVFKVGIHSVYDSVASLMDISPGRKIEGEVKRILLSTKGVEGFKNLKLRRSGPFIFGEVDIKVRGRLTVGKAHEIADEIEERVKKKIDEIDSFTIHVEPHEAEKAKVVVPIEKEEGFESPLAEKFGRANFFIFLQVDRKRKRVLSSYVKKNPFKRRSAKAGFSVAEFLVKENVDAVVAKEMGGITFHALRDNLVEVYSARGKRVKDVLRYYFLGKLKRMSRPTKKIV